jgi:hypothetical protein
MPKAGKKLVFYVDTECFFSNESSCSYYSEKRVQELVGKNAQHVWGRDCCPIVYVKKGRRYRAFCPTRGGAWGEELPATTGPKREAVRVEVQPRSDESWIEIVEKVAAVACKTRI